MSFCLRPNVCKKCGKPLTLFEGWTCLECEKAEQEPSVNDALEQIRDEISKLPDMNKAGVFSSVRMKGMILKIIDKYREENTDAT